jgi:hypothetical protein
MQCDQLDSFEIVKDTGASSVLRAKSCFQEVVRFESLSLCQR